MSYHLGMFVQEFVGAAILAMFYVWLRRRQVKDPSLLWLSFSLLSWSLAAAATLAFENDKEIAPLIKYVFSPVSSILFAMTAFRLSRMREFIHTHRLTMWRDFFVGGVVTLSIAALILIWLGGGPREGAISDISLIGMSLDALASTLALFALGCGLAYSFYKYGNPLLIVLTIIDLSYMVFRQLEAVWRLSFGDSSPGGGIRAALNFSSFSTLTMLFIALAVAWSLSETARFKRACAPAHVKIIAVFLDLRGATQWERGKDVAYVGKFIDALFEWAIKYFSPIGKPSLVKFLGDGFLYIWEVSDECLILRCNQIGIISCKMHESYAGWVSRTRSMWMGAPRAIALGIDFGSALRLTFENGSIDYIGEPVNYAAKMQDLARPNGGAVIRDHRKFSAQLRQRFPVAGYLMIGDALIEVRATKGIRLQHRA